MQCDDETKRRHEMARNGDSLAVPWSGEVVEPSLLSATPDGRAADDSAMNFKRCDPASRIFRRLASLLSRRASAMIQIQVTGETRISLGNPQTMCIMDSSNLTINRRVFGLEFVLEYVTR